jgi:hypothetical protein
MGTQDEEKEGLGKPPIYAILVLELFIQDKWLKKLELLVLNYFKFQSLLGIWEIVFSYAISSVPEFWNFHKLLSGNPTFFNQYKPQFIFTELLVWYII